MPEITTPSSPEFPFPNRTNYLTGYPQGGGVLIGWVNFKAIDWIMVLGVMPGEEQSSVPTAGNSFFGPLVGTVSWVLVGPLKMLYCRLHQQYLLAMKNIPQGEGQGLPTCRKSDGMDGLTCLQLSYPLHYF